MSVPQGERGLRRSFYKRTNDPWTEFLTSALDPSTKRNPGKGCTQKGDMQMTNISQSDSKAASSEGTASRSPSRRENRHRHNIVCVKNFLKRTLSFSHDEPEYYLDFKGEQAPKRQSKASPARKLSTLARAPSKTPKPNHYSLPPPSKSPSPPTTQAIRTPTTSQPVNPPPPKVAAYIPKHAAADFSAQASGRSRTVAPTSDYEAFIAASRLADTSSPSLAALSSAAPTTPLAIAPSSYAVLREKRLSQLSADRPLSRTSSVTRPESRLSRKTSSVLGAREPALQRQSSLLSMVGEYIKPPREPGLAGLSFAERTAAGQRRLNRRSLASVGEARMEMEMGMASGAGSGAWLRNRNSMPVGGLRRSVF